MSKKTHTADQRSPAPALDQTIATTLTRRHQASTLRRLSLAPSNAVDFSSNDFLSLSHSPLLRSRFLHEINENSNHPIASGGSRLLDGNTRYAQSLERLIADFHQAPAALLTNSGFDANAAIFSVLPQKDDVVIYDSLIHASVHDGMRASRCPIDSRHAFEHNSVSDFKTTLRSVIDSSEAFKQGHASIFVAVEAIYSMDGDVAPLKALIAAVDEGVAKDLRQNVHFIVDEAHATGCLGVHGRGLVSSLGLENRISIRLHTFGKALAANGAAILCSEAVKMYLLNYARPLIYTTFLSFPALALIKASYSLLIDGSTDKMAFRLRGNMDVLHKALAKLQDEIHQKALDIERAEKAALIKVNMALPQSPIFSIETCNPRDMASYCQTRGYVVRPIMPPTVQKGSERVRVCLHAGNSVEEILDLVKSMREWCHAHLSCGMRKPLCEAHEVTAEWAKL